MDCLGLVTVAGVGCCALEGTSAVQLQIVQSWNLPGLHETSPSVQSHCNALNVCELPASQTFVAKQVPQEPQGGSLFPAR